MKWRCRAQRRVGNVTEMAAHSNTKGAESAPLPACRGGRFAQGPGQDRREAPPAPGAREGAVGWAAARQARPGPAVRPHLAAPFLTSPPPSRSGGVYGDHGQAGMLAHCRPGHCGHLGWDASVLGAGWLREPSGLRV